MPATMIKLFLTTCALPCSVSAQAADDTSKPADCTLASSVCKDVTSVPKGDKAASEILVEDAEKREEIKTVNIQSSYKRCLNEHSNDGSKKTYSPKEIEDYCGCFSVLINERVTNDEWLADLKAERWAQNPKLIATTKYCRDTYKGLPDVTAIRKKKW